VEHFTEALCSLYCCRRHKFAINPLNSELNPICHLLALLGAHHIFHVSGLRVKPFLADNSEGAVGDVGLRSLCCFYCGFEYGLGPG